jgi:hypothetical protein
MGAKSPRSDNNGASISVSLLAILHLGTVLPLRGCPFLHVRRSPYRVDNSHDAAADACIRAVEAKASAQSRVERIKRVESNEASNDPSVDSGNQSEWRVEGIIRRSATGTYAVRKDFICSLDRGTVSQVNISKEI